MQKDDKDKKRYEEALDRLTKELRSSKLKIMDIRLCLSSYGDLGLLTPLGAIKHLIKYRKLVDDISSLLKKSSRNPDAAAEILIEVERLIENA